MISHKTTDRQLHAQDRLADRGIGLDLTAPAESHLDTRLANESNALVELYKNSPQIRSALEKHAEEMDLNVELPGQMTFGMNSKAIERFGQKHQKPRRSLEINLT